MKLHTKKIIILFITCFIFFLGGCGGNNTTLPMTSDGVVDVESGSNRLDELRKQKKEDAAEKAAEAEAAAAEAEAAEARRQEERDSITKNDALLDAIVGEWGFVAPRWVGTVPAGFTSTKDPMMRFYLFSETGIYGEYKTYNDNGKISPLKRSGQFALDEQNNTIYLFDDEYDGETELRYVFKDGNLEMYGGFEAFGTYEEDYETELFKADWESVWSGIGQKNVDFIEELVNDNPDYVPDFYKQSKNITTNTELSNALVGQWGTVTPAWMEDTGYGTYYLRPAMFCYKFFEDGKVVLTYTAPDEDGTQEMEGVYYWDEAKKLIMLSFNDDSTEFSYSYNTGTFKLYGGFFDGNLFSQEGLIELFKADWSDVCSNISEMEREKRDDYLKDYLKKHPEYKSEFFSRN